MPENPHGPLEGGPYEDGACRLTELPGSEEDPAMSGFSTEVRFADHERDPDLAGGRAKAFNAREGASYWGGTPAERAAYDAFWRRDSHATATEMLIPASQETLDAQAAYAVWLVENPDATAEARAARKAEIFTAGELGDALEVAP